MLVEQNIKTALRMASARLRDEVRTHRAGEAGRRAARGAGLLVGALLMDDLEPTSAGCSRGRGPVPRRGGARARRSAVQLPGSARPVEPPRGRPAGPRDRVRRSRGPLAAELAGVGLRPARARDPGRGRGAHQHALQGGRARPYCLRQGECRTLLSADRFLGLDFRATVEGIGAELPALEWVAYPDEVAAMLAEPPLPGSQWPALSPDDVGYMIYTSGTTSFSRACSSPTATSRATPSRPAARWTCVRASAC